MPASPRALRTTRDRRRCALVAPLLLTTLLASGCGVLTAEEAAPPVSAPSSAPAPTTGTPSPATPTTPTTPATPAPPPRPVPSDGTPRDALLSIPALGIVDLPVETYAGRTDDAAGTEIQDGGVAASPHGPEGGTGPGGVGNYQVTAHRLSSTRAFEDLPDLVDGDVALVEVGELTYVYEVVETRQVSFRDPASLTAQRAPVPGRPGVAPTEAMLTLSTCRTPEDRAEGNYWSDEFGNPEHRIDKIGRLVEVVTG